MIEASAAMKTNDYRVAVRNFVRVEELNVKVPATFPYHYGVALAETGEFDQAKQQLDRYITKAGSRGKFYKEALEMYAKAEAGEAAVAKRAKEIEKANAGATAKYNEAKIAYDQKMQNCPSEYEKYESSLQRDLDRLGQECHTYSKYNCMQYHDDPRAMDLKRRKNAAIDRFDNRPSESDWCKRRYTPPAVPVMQ